LNAVDGRTQTGHDEQQPHLRPAGERVDQQYAGQCGERQLADDDQQPPVEVVGQCAADERHEQQRDQLAQPDEANQ
jgi:hypothetical protein